MYYIWMGLCLISTVIVYFYVPETRQIPIEEIGALFGDEVVVHLTANGTQIVEDKIGVEMIENREDLAAGDAHAATGDEKLSTGPV